MDQACTWTYGEWLDQAVRDGSAPDIACTISGHRCLLVSTGASYTSATAAAAAARASAIPVGASTSGPGSNPASPPVPLSPLEYEALLDLVAAGDVAEELAARGLGDAVRAADGTVCLAGQGAAARARQQVRAALALKAATGGRIVAGGAGPGLSAMELGGACGRPGAWEQTIRAELATLPPLKPLTQLWREQQARGRAWQVEQQRGPAGAKGKGPGAQGGQGGPGGAT